MRYEAFEGLIRLKMGLGRRLHEAGPAYRDPIRKAMRVIDDKLATDTEYEVHLKEFAKRVRVVG